MIQNVCLLQVCHMFLFILYLCYFLLFLVTSFTVFDLICEKLRLIFFIVYCGFNVICGFNSADTCFFLLMFQALIPLLLSVSLGIRTETDSSTESSQFSITENVDSDRTESDNTYNIDYTGENETTYSETCDEINSTGIFLTDGSELNLKGNITVIFRIVPHLLYTDQVEMYVLV